MSGALVFDVFGKRMLAERSPGGWRLLALGSDGKRTPVDVAIPASIGEEELAQFLDDIFHEAARPRHSCVRRITGA